MPARAEKGWLVVEGLGPVSPTPLGDGPAKIFLRPHMVRAAHARPGSHAALVRHMLPSEGGRLRVLVEWEGMTMEGYAQDELRPGAACGLEFSGAIAFPMDPSGLQADRILAAAP